MNKVIIIGRITKDLDVKTAQSSGKSYLFFSVAVDRKFKDSQGNKQTDFLECKAFGKTADFIGQYFAKGNKICLSGAMQTDKWTDQNGNERSQVYIAVDEAEFVESRQNGQQVARTVAVPAAPVPVAPAPVIEAEPKVQAVMDFFEAEAEGSQAKVSDLGVLPFEL